MISLEKKNCCKASIIFNSRVYSLKPYPPIHVYKLNASNLVNTGLHYYCETLNYISLHNISVQ